MAPPDLSILDHLAKLLAFDPFEYLVVTIVGVIVWTWCSVIGDFALTGRGIWMRWASLFAAALGAVLFFHTARLLD